MSDHRIHLFEEFALDLTRGSLLRDHEPVHLRPQTYEVLTYLVEHRGQLISKDKLIAYVWHGRAVTDGSLGKCIEELRVALGDNSAEYVRNVRGRGYIFEARVQELAEPAALATRSEQVDVVTVTIEEHEELSEASGPKAFPLLGRGSQANKGWKVGVITAGVLALAIGSFIGYRVFSKRASSKGTITSIAVLPFKNESGSPDIEYLSDGMTESLINSLARMSPLSVKARSSVFHYKSKEIDPRRVAAELSVDAILSGRLVQRSDNLTLYLSLVDGATGNQIWGEQYDRKSDNLLAMQRDITRDVSEKLRARLTEDKERLLAPSTNSPAAHQAYLKGLYYWNRGSEKSIEYFQQAIDQDPNYSLGYAGLAHYYAFGAAQGRLPPDQNWPKAEAALTRALALDENRAESYNVLAGIQLYYHRDWLAAERSFRKGIELKGDSGQLHHHYARCLYLFGRNDEAIAEMQHAIDLEPFSITYSLNLARLYLSIRQYDNAIEQFRKTLDLEPDSRAAHDWLGNAYEMKGLQREAIGEWMRALVLNEQLEQAADLDRTYSRSGFNASVHALGQQQLENLKESAKRGDYVPAVEYLNAYTRMGDTEQAFDWLEKALQERNRFALEVKSNPIYDNMRSDSRFQASLRKVGL
jgi:TolB-like protein/DNA-binding winged helix-turn-helix (wHTH) protein/Tfp pilus assembly protein PilF